MCFSVLDLKEDNSLPLKIVSSVCTQCQQEPNPGQGTKDTVVNKMDIVSVFMQHKNLVPHCLSWQPYLLFLAIDPCHFLM